MINQIIQLVKEIPNDQELGRAIRQLLTDDVIIQNTIPVKEIHVSLSKNKVRTKL